MVSVTRGFQEPERAVAKEVHSSESANDCGAGRKIDFLHSAPYQADVKNECIGIRGIPRHAACSETGAYDEVSGGWKDGQIPHMVDVRVRPNNSGYYRETHALGLNGVRDIVEFINASHIALIASKKVPSMLVASGPLDISRRPDQRVPFGCSVVTRLKS